jgi:hypothetical protein
MILFRDDFCIGQRGGRLKANTFTQGLITRPMRKSSRNENIYKLITILAGSKSANTRKKICIGRLCSVLTNLNYMYHKGSFHLIYENITVVN